MSPQRIQRQRTKGWRMPENTVYVGRGSRWGNPFHIQSGHHLVGPTWGDVRENWGRVIAANVTAAYVTSSSALGPGELVSQYRMLIDVRVRDESERMRAWLAPLVGKNLACWCRLDQPCHADVLLALATTTPAP